MATASAEREGGMKSAVSCISDVLGTELRIRPVRVSLRKLERRLVRRRWMFVWLPV